MIAVDPEEWMVDGACRGADPDIFFPGQGEATRPAKAICATCPIRAACLEYALDNGIAHGIWGGKSERERRVMRGNRPTMQARVLRHLRTHGPADRREIATALDVTEGTVSSALQKLVAYGQVSAYIPRNKSRRNTYTATEQP